MRPLEPRFKTSVKINRRVGIAIAVIAPLFILSMIYLQIAIAKQWWPY